ncbi:DUF853 family protein [Bailinhaonella thermotolerans]|uniref:DUF853 family protein n=1 Tax=Bailinhaonella thermotolerans TaxID=1070861 RepID=A0A3A4ARU1_9ACTN|nr:DUF853 family protein [Bailinhaonella thermotolerans]
MGCCTVLAAALIIIPALIAAALFLALRNWCSKTHWVIIAAAGAVGLCFAPAPNLAAYGQWLASLAGLGDGRRGHIPLVPILALALIFAGLAGLARDSQIMTLDAPLARRLLAGRRLQRDPLVPSERRRARLLRKLQTDPPLGYIPAVRGPRAQPPTAKSDPPGKRKFPLGIGARARPVMLGEHEIGMHGVILGSTGSGKTETIKWLMGALLDMGWDGMIIDLKEDTAPGGLRDQCRAATAMHGLPYQEMALSDHRGRFWFNTLAGMGPDEAFDTLMSLVQFDDAYWQNLNRKMLAQVLRMSYQAHELAPDRFPFPDVLTIGRLLERGEKIGQATKEMRAVIDAHAPGTSKAEYGMIAQPIPDAAKSAAGFGMKLTNLYDSDAGKYVLTGGGGRTQIDVTAGGLTYIGLNSLGQPDMSRIVSSAVLQRVSVDAAQRTTGRAAKGKPKFIIVDEANWVNREIVMNLLSRARSAGVCMFLCTQGPNDWIDSDGDDWARLSQNINVAIIMAQGAPESAEKCAEFLGEEKAAQLSHKVVDGEVIDIGTVSVRDDLIVTSAELRSLEVGEAILRVNKPKTRVEYVRIPQRLEELDWYARHHGRAA